MCKVVFSVMDDVWLLSKEEEVVILDDFMVFFLNRYLV